jgi:hypothetical protein
MPVGLSPNTAPTIKSKSVGNIRQLLQLVNNLLAAKHRRIKRPISLTTRSLSRPALTEFTSL